MSPGLVDRTRRRVGRRAKRIRGQVAPIAQSLGGRVPRLPPAHVPEGPVSRPEVRVAVVLDEFSELAWRYEWDQVPVTPGGWREELAARPPQLLFVESSWNGNRGAWRLAMSNGPSADLRALVGWCREQGVPTVFWNKEDPPGYERFLATARLFDHVFTVDSDLVDGYRSALGHDRVGVLPFAAQPRIHNPVQRWGPGRVHDVAFAGTYFAEKHSERRAQMDYVLRPALAHGLHVYSRMQAEDARYRFPPEYRRHVVGTLPYPRMLAANTAYKVVLNVNSVTRSPTMCARRLFELSAAQTPVLSGPAAAIEPVFGDDVTVVRDERECETGLEVLLRHKEHRDRIALRAHRRVFAGHLYEHRARTVLAAVGLPDPPRDRTVSAVVPTMRPERVDAVLAAVAAQRHDVELVLVPHGFDVDVRDVRARAHDLGLDHVQVVPAGDELTLGACLNLGVRAASGRYVAKMDDDNYYAPDYLTDLVAVFSYSEAAVTGKWAHYVHLAASGATLLRFEDSEHRDVDLVQGGTILAEADTVRRVPFEDLPRRVDTTFLEKVRRAGGTVHAADRFNFVSIRSPGTVGHTWRISDAELMTRSSRLVFYGDPREHVTT